MPAALRTNNAGRDLETIKALEGTLPTYEEVTELRRMLGPPDCFLRRRPSAILTIRPHGRATPCETLVVTFMAQPSRSSLDLASGP
ncbi:hypothetical protein LK07_32705 [Streptomyces pluripotens]|uniref:Uncharacterized protein n=1 Tax=Streptomyces pluripotens TaxID=1355015 RepID=A0A221P7K5_9ACTN|nr:hypothetical protein LK06_031505 [Streptomyces pluripotens]ASN27988.1 hypothetical protein LK07_32705 [Streptomyces pluripotens]KIE27906.1 hypothetical protein LK08_05435 [Streptomyces sp. MUSC 125]